MPLGAKFLFVAASDSHYGTNADPDGDYVVRISPFSAVPEPSTGQLLAFGLTLTLAFSAKGPLARVTRRAAARVRA